MKLLSTPNRFLFSGFLVIMALAFYYLGAYEYAMALIFASGVWVPTKSLTNGFIKSE